ncbi:MAG: glutamyl-tRNA reductase [Myxococcales bacterium]|nr:glutamyl-tRNA reductase [Myxococcales bacterium]
MERIALIGVSHRRGGVAALEAWHQAWDERTLSDIVSLGFQEAVRLSTCNRCDLIVAMPEGMDVHEARRLLAPSDWPRCYVYEGEAAVEQLCRIAASLDSLNPGEDQIMSQVRDAFSAAEAEGTTGSETSFAFSTAFRVAKRIRREVELAPVKTSLFSLARPEMDRYLSARSHVAVLGTGKMGRIAARSLCDRAGTTLYLVNRSIERAQELAQELDGSAEIKILSLAEFRDQPPLIEGLVCATAQAELVDLPFLQKMPSLRVLVDLGMPRNVSFGAATQCGVPCFDVETLEEAGQRRRSKIESALFRAEEILLDELDSAINEWIERQLGPSLQALRSHYIEKIGDSLPEQEARQMANRFAHLPMKGLRVLAREHGLHAARTFLSVMESSTR